MAKHGPSGVSVMRSDLDAATSTSADAHEAQWRAGVNRQAQPQAISHQHAASQAAAEKRKATAMVGEEKAAADRLRADRRNAAKRAKRAAAAEPVAAAVAEPTVAESPAVEVAALGRLERLDLDEWLAHKDLPLDDASLEEWRMSDHYERTKRDRIVEQCTCFHTPDGGKRVTSLPYEEVKRRVDDDMLQGGDSFEAWDARVLADREARGVSIGEYFERPWLFNWCGTFRKCTCTYDGHGDEARMLPDVPGQNCDAFDEGAAQQLERQVDDWQPSGGDWVPEGWDGAEPQPGDDTEREVPSPEPSSPPPLPPPPLPLQRASPPPPADDDSDAYELDQERLLEEQGRVSAIHGRPWHEVPSSATEPIHWLDYVRRPFDWLASSLTLSQPQRPVSPAPEAADFETEDAFLHERARWFREHGDGSELSGTANRTTSRQRLKDRPCLAFAVIVQTRPAHHAPCERVECNVD